jgi:antitoxin ParD1/3/4
MNVSVPHPLEEFVNELVQSGLCQSADEAVEKALYLLKDQYDLYKVKREELRKEVDVGLEQADRGELTDGELVFQQLRAKMPGVTAQQKAPDGRGVRPPGR